MIALRGLWRVTVVSGGGLFWHLAGDQHGRRCLCRSKTYLLEDSAWNELPELDRDWEPYGLADWCWLPPGDMGAELSQEDLSDVEVERTTDSF